MVEIMVVLNAYHPPYSKMTGKVLDLAVEGCYQPFIEKLLENKNIKILLSFSGSLTELLAENYSSLLKLYRDGIEEGQIELLQTPAYHPILPLIGTKKREWQIQKNKEINNAALIGNSSPTGFFPPELAVNYKLVDHLGKLGYKFTIVPENSIPADRDHLYFTGKEEDKIFMIPVSKQFSEIIRLNHGNVAVKIAELDKLSSDQTLPVVIAMDLEHFSGSHDRPWEYLFNLLNHKDVLTIHSDQYLARKLEEIKLKTIKSTSWRTDDVDIKNNPFPLWADNKNIIQKIQLEHLDLVHKAIMKSDFPSLADEFQRQILGIMHSHQFFLASGVNISPVLLVKGFEMQQEVLAKLTNKDTLLTLSEMLYSKLLAELNKH